MISTVIVKFFSFLCGQTNLFSGYDKRTGLPAIAMGNLVPIDPARTNQ